MNYTKTGWAIIIIVCIVFAVLLFMSLKSGIIKDKSVLIGLTLLLLIAPVIYIISILPYKQDINEKSYREYQGEFFVDDYYTTKGGTYILIRTDSDIPTRYRAPSNSAVSAESFYHGKFVIARHSKTLLEISVNK